MYVSLISAVVGMLMLAASTGSLLCAAGTIMAIEGTAAKKMLNSAVFGLSVLVILFAMILMYCDVMKSDYVSTGLHSLIIMLYGYIARFYYHRDNWFKDQFDKQKTGVKNFVERISRVMAPKPLGSPT